MKLLLDQGVPQRAVGLLRDAGHEVVHACEVGLSSADDRAVVQWCLAHDAAIVTLDADFHSLIALSGERAPSAIRIRVQGLKAAAVARLLLHVMTAHGEALREGALLTVRPDRVRLRRLPIARRP